MASAARQRLPDGTAPDLLDVLGQLSRDHDIDWSIRHDYSDGPIGYVRGGVCDAEVLTQIEALADLVDLLGDLTAGSETQPGGFPSSTSRGSARDVEENDDDGPSLLPFRPKGP